MTLRFTGMTLRFTVPGTPRGKGRPKFVRATGRAYTDAQTASYENLVKLSAIEALGRAGLICTSHPVALTVVVRLAPPRSATRKHRVEMLCGERHPTKKPDLDNVVKAVLDGLNGVAFADDAQVIHLMASKTYADIAGVDVVVRPINDLQEEVA